jgi:hypothetical protein
MIKNRIIVAKGLTLYELATLPGYVLISGNGKAIQLNQEDARKLARLLQIFAVTGGLPAEDDEVQDEMDTTTEELNRWIAKHGSARDALNTALDLMHGASADASDNAKATWRANNDNDRLQAQLAKAKAALRDMVSEADLQDAFGDDEGRAVLIAAARTLAELEAEDEQSNV